jgi:hypothetical protein
LAKKIPASKGPVTKEDGDGGKEEGKQRNKGPEKWNRATEKGENGTIDRIRRQRKEDVTEDRDGRQETETRDTGQRTGDRGEIK